MTLLDPLTFTVECDKFGFYIADDEGCEVSSFRYLNANDAWAEIERLIAEDEDAKREH